MSLPVFSSVAERLWWVKAQLGLKGVSFASIGRDNGWSRTVVALAMRLPSDPQERAIAEALGVSQQELFPERYGPDGQRLHLVRQSKAARAPGNVKHHKAA